MVRKITVSTVMIVSLFSIGIATYFFAIIEAVKVGESFHIISMALACLLMAYAAFALELRASFEF